MIERIRSIYNLIHAGPIRRRTNDEYKGIYREIFTSKSMPNFQQYLCKKGYDELNLPYFIALCIDIVLRGISQVFLCNHPITGILVCLGLLLSSFELMLFAIFGTAVATLSAAVIGQPERDNILAGLCGYDGALVSCACYSFLERDYAIYASLYLSILAGIVHVACVNILKVWQVPCFTFAFNIVMILYLFADSNGYIISHIKPSIPSTVDTNMSLLFVIDASLKGVGQFMFVDTTIGSALVVAGICICSRQGALAAVVGATIGWISALYILQATNIENIRNGLYGYNSAGTCSSLAGGIFYITSDSNLFIGVIGALLSSLFNVGFQGILGLPVLTFPFIISTWIIMLSRSKWLTSNDGFVKPIYSSLRSAVSSMSHRSLRYNMKHDINLPPSELGNVRLRSIIHNNDNDANSTPIRSINEDLEFGMNVNDIDNNTNTNTPSSIIEMEEETRYHPHAAHHNQSHHVLFSLNDDF